MQLILFVIKMKNNGFFFQLIGIFLVSFISMPFCSRAADVYQENNIGFAEKEGFTFKTPVESLNIGGYVEVDTRVFLGPTSSKSTFLIRRARMFMTGILYKHFSFMLMPRWDRLESFELHYAWIETLHPTWAQIRVGLFKEPFSLEALTADLFLTFVERSLIVRNFCQIEDIGIMVYGDFLSDRIAYSIGMFNGRGRRIDNNNNKEIVGRLVYRLFDLRKYGQFHLGISGSGGRHDEDLSETFFVTEEDTRFWEWQNGVEVHSTRIRWGMDVEWLVGPFEFRAEYLYANWGKIERYYRSKNFEAQGGYVQCSYILTGEEKPRNNPVIPKYNYDPYNDHWGAWEIGLRYEVFYASKAMIDEDFAKGANDLHGPTFSLNWYLNPRIVMKLDGQHLWFNRTVFFNSHRFNQESVIVWRVQCLF